MEDQHMIVSTSMMQYLEEVDLHLRNSQAIPEHTFLTKEVEEDEFDPSKIEFNPLDNIPLGNSRDFVFSIGEEEMKDQEEEIKSNVAD